MILTDLAIKGDYEGINRVLGEWASDRRSFMEVVGLVAQQLSEFCYQPSESSAYRFVARAASGVAVILNITDSGRIDGAYLACGA